MSRLIPLALLAAFVTPPIYAASCSSTSSNLVANCGFETGDFTSWTLIGYDSGPGFYGIDYGVDAADAHSGSYGAYLGGFGGILYLSQQLTTTPGTTYDVTFWLAQSPTPVAPYVDSFSAAFGSSTLVSLANVPDLNYTEYSYQAVASSTTTLLEFGFRDDTGFFSLDDVSVNAMSTPEASTNQLCIAAFLLAAYALLTLRNKAGGRSSAMKAAVTK